MADTEIPLAVVGATGVVGKQVLSVLALRDHDAGVIRAFASERSEGTELELDEDTLDVEQLGADAFRGVKAVILAVPPELAKPLAERAQREGVWAVDCSGAFRVDAGVPLVAPGVNDAVLRAPFEGRIVGLAGSPAQGLLAVLAPLKERFGLTVADCTVLMGAASRGNAGVEQLAKQTASLMNAREPDVEVFPHRLAFNVVPADPPFEHGLSRSERSLLVEVARVWHGPALPAVTCTTMWVPLYHGLVLSLTAHLGKSTDADGVRAALKASSALKLLDEPNDAVVPMPMLTNDDPTVHVGRVRVLGERVQLVAALDNAHRLADGAVRVALELAGRS